jgi:hypothetical protein
MSCAGHNHDHQNSPSFLPAVIALGALFGAATSPCSRGALWSSMALVMVPWLTFAIAAPSRMPLVRQLRLFGADLESVVLYMLARVAGRRDAATRVQEAHRQRVEHVYAGTSAADLVTADPERLHHARRVAFMTASTAIISSLAVPFAFPSVFTYGTGLSSVVVFGIDLVVACVVIRLVTERAALRLAESSFALGDQLPHARVRLVPLFAMLGGAMGLVGGMLVLLADGAASAVETYLVFGQSMARSFSWFVATMSPLTMVTSMLLGSVMGVSIALAQRASNTTAE